MTRLPSYSRPALGKEGRMACVILVFLGVVLGLLQWASVLHRGGVL